MTNDILKCPNCNMVLTCNNNQYVCASGHSFDVSKEGYVNLILPNKKKTKSPGDDKEMVVARANFLNSGFYSALAKEISYFVNKYCRKNSVVLDAGCGTGYYLNNIGQGFQKIGIDISKDAIKYAAKNNKQGLYIVASIFDMPVLDKSIDCVLNIFAPKPDSELLRVLKNGGIVVEVVPGKNHLIELKKVLYDNVHLNRENVKEFSLNCIEQKNITYTQNLNNKQLKELFNMTPYGYKTPYHSIDKLKNIGEIGVTCDFVIKVWVNK